MGSQSVDLHNRGVNIDELRATGWEPTTGIGTFQDSETDAGGDDRMTQLLMTLQSINAKHATALNVLLHSAVGRLTRKETAHALRISEHTVQRCRVWLAREYPNLGACLNNPAL